MKAFIIGVYSFFSSFFDFIILRYVMNLPSRRIRKAILKLKFKKIGNSTNFLMGIEYRSPKNIIIGDNCVINKNVLLDARGGQLIIGNNVDIAQETNIWTLEHDINDDYHLSKGGDVVIEDYVWIASRVTILPGVKIEKGAVIASGSVVTKDVLSNTVVGGIPAKEIGKRSSKLLYNLNYNPIFK